MNTTTQIKKKVLVIDDNSGILFIMQKALAMKEYDVHVSETFTGVEAIKRISPDLIYLDVSLVGQDGCEIAKTLKSTRRTKHIPIIILTAYPNAEQLTEEAGADDYLPKPFELEHLWEMTAQYTSGPKKGLIV